MAFNLVHPRCFTLAHLTPDVTTESKIWIKARALLRLRAVFFSTQSSKEAKESNQLRFCMADRTPPISKYVSS